PNLTSLTNGFSTPPFLWRTMPIRRTTCRVKGVSASQKTDSHRLQTPEENPSPKSVLASVFRDALVLPKIATEPALIHKEGGAVAWAIAVPSTCVASTRDRMISRLFASV